MELTRPERAWLTSYRKALVAQFPGLVETMLIYGSKARGDARSDSDLDVLLLVKDRAAERKRALRRIGYLLAATGEVVPSIMAYTHSEWEKLKKSSSPYQRAVERDAVRIL
jgi:predicted nucleotidyltransferase